MLNSDPAAFAMNGAAWTFHRGADDALQYCWTDHAASTTGRWERTNWQRTDAPGRGRPAVCSPAPDRDRFDIFVRGDDAQCWYRCRDAQNWSTWESLGGILQSEPAAMAMGGAAWTFHRGTDDALYFRWIRSPGGPQSDWQRIDAPGHSEPAVCSPAPDRDRFDIFVRGDDGQCWYRCRDGQNWSDWESLGGILNSEPAAMAMGGAAWTFHRGTDDALYFRWIEGPGGPRSDWQRMEPVDSANLMA